MAVHTVVAILIAVGEVSSPTQATTDAMTGAVAEALGPDTSLVLRTMPAPSDDEALAIERHGQPIGFYIPTGGSRQESFAQALERLEQTVQRILVETGMSEDELSRLYDLTQPVPDQPRRQSSGGPSEAQEGA